MTALEDFATMPPKLFLNPRVAGPDEDPGEEVARLLDARSAAAARQTIASWPGYAPTALVTLPGLAAAAEVGAIAYKDEGTRFGLASFKALGGPLAVWRLLATRAGADGRTPEPAALRAAARGLTVACATGGNHGRAVAWAAATFGCACVIYIHDGVGRGRAEAIARFGARVVRVQGTYDACVRRAQADARAGDWSLISDTAGDDFGRIQLDILEGYTLVVDEALRQLEGDAPTHVFVAGGVGGLAAAVAGHLRQGLGPARPRVVVVEPETAACLQMSAMHGKPTPFPGDLATIMVCLSAGEVNVPAWRILDRLALAFMTVPDAASPAGMRLLAEGVGGDPPVVAGESGVAGLAGLLAACAQREARAALGLGPTSRVLVVGSEGATDPALYARIVGREPDRVAAARGRPSA